MLPIQHMLLLHGELSIRPVERSDHTELGVPIIVFLVDEPAYIFLNLSK